MSSVLSLARPDILQLQPYQHATWDPSLERMHANEMPWRAQGDNTVAGLNRYPEPQPRALVERMARLYAVPAGLADLGITARTLARLESLDAHANAVSVRLDAIAREADA